MTFRWSSVNSKKNAVYIWLALDRNSRKIIGCYVGDRTRKSARKLWASLSEVYQQCTFAYTDFWQAYKTVIPCRANKSLSLTTTSISLPYSACLDCMFDVYNGIKHAVNSDLIDPLSLSVVKRLMHSVRLLLEFLVPLIVQGVVSIPAKS
ncbi:MAG: IS1 family transposase [Chroococcidiopsidaceae cyanobacterium CP_BM_RX_35]|nr:IS1 family transposase [Chroococcidiopsidaceae cyanobacterium CP_BM_RX_35]